MSLNAFDHCLFPNTSQSNGNMNNNNNNNDTSVVDEMQFQVELHDLYENVINKIAQEPMSTDAVEVERAAWTFVMRKYKTLLVIVLFLRFVYIYFQLWCLLSLKFIECFHNKLPHGPIELYSNDGDKLSADIVRFPVKEGY